MQAWHTLSSLCVICIVKLPGYVSIVQDLNRAIVSFFFVRNYYNHYLSYFITIPHRNYDCVFLTHITHSQTDHKREPNRIEPR